MNKQEELNKLVEFLKSKGFNYAATKVINNYYKYGFIDGDCSNSVNTFWWDSTEEGQNFWQYIDCKLENDDWFYYNRYKR